jgi:hypothetical protein
MTNLTDNRSSGEVVTAPLNTSIHSRNLERSRSNWHKRRVTNSEDKDYKYKHSYKSIERDHQPMHLQWTERPYPWRRPYRNPKAKSRDNLRVSKFTTTFLPIERSAPISVCVYAYSSSILEEAHLLKNLVIATDTLLERWISTEEDLSTNEGLLPPRTSAQAKCTYGEDTLRWKRTYSGDTLHRVMCIYGQRSIQFLKPTTMTTMTWMTSRSTYIMDNRSSPTLRIIFNCNCINDIGWNWHIKRQQSFDTQ